MLVDKWHHTQIKMTASSVWAGRPLFDLMSPRLPHGDHSFGPVRLLTLPFVHRHPGGALQRQLRHSNSVLGQDQAPLSITVTDRRHDTTHHLVLAWRGTRDRSRTQQYSSGDVCSVTSPKWSTKKHKHHLRRSILYFGASMYVSGETERTSPIGDTHTHTFALERIQMQMQ